MIPDFTRFSALRFFTGFNLRQMGAVFERIEARLYEQGELALGTHQSELGIHYIIDGSVKIYITVEEQELTLGVLTADDFFGEASVVEEQPPSALVRAEEPTLIYFLPKKVFQELVESGTGLSSKLWESLARSLIARMKKSNATMRSYFEVNKALCENPKFREFYQLCQFGS
jgi:CRP/FNR family transcriptional regulator, cyclic AMP receptor protein